MQAEEKAAQIAEMVRQEVLALLDRGDNWTLTLHGAASGNDVKLDVRRVAHLVMQSSRAGSQIPNQIDNP